ADEEPVQKGKRVKRSAKKSSTTPAAGIVFRETLVNSKSTGKEKVYVSRGKGIDLLSEGNDEDDSNNKQKACDKGSGQENASEEQESDSEQDEESEDDNQEEEEIDQENK
ncbi:hypothetical protein Tco_0341913, partial [Tanacetum coccineum]